MSPTPFLLAGTMQASSSQYDSFLFWRQPIPELDLSELEEVGGGVSQPASKKMSAGRGQEEEVRREGGGWGVVLIKEGRGPEEGEKTEIELVVGRERP